MGRRNVKYGVASLLFFALLFLAWTPPASAQGCAMCYTSAAGQDPKAQKALDAGIFTLASPILLFAGGVVFVAYKRRNAPDDSEDEFSGNPELPSGSDLAQPRILRLPLDS